MANRKDDDNGEGGDSDAVGCAICVLIYVFGSALAMTISWSLRHSLIAAIVNGAMSWFFVIYYAVART